MYVVSYIVALFSLFYLVKIRIPPKPAPVVTQKKKSSWRENLQATRSDLVNFPDYSRFILDTLLHSLGMWMALPLYMLYYVRDLQADDAWIGLQGAVASLAAIAGFLLWRKWMQRLGELRTLRYTIVLAGLFPILVGLTPSLTMILVWIALNGVLAGGISLSHVNTLLRVTPEHDRPGFTALYLTIMNIGVFISPIVGVWLADRFGFPPVLIACGLFSCLGSFSFWAWPIQCGEND
jgi:MFS family permease